MLTFGACMLTYPVHKRKVQCACTSKYLLTLYIMMMTVQIHARAHTRTVTHKHTLVTHIQIYKYAYIKK